MLSLAASIRRNPRSDSGLLLWLDAGSISREGAVESWPSLVGGLVASAPSKFTRPSASLGQYPAVVFDGEYACLTLPQISPGSSWRAFVVCARSGGSTYGTIMQLLSSASTQSAMIGSNNDSTQGPIQISSGSTHVKGGSLATGVRRILTVGPSVLKQNGVSATTAAITAPVTPFGTLSMVGAANSSAPVRFFDGSIHEIRLYSSLSATQEASIYAELAAKWGVA